MWINLALPDSRTLDVVNQILGSVFNARVILEARTRTVGPSTDFGEMSRKGEERKWSRLRSASMELHLSLSSLFHVFPGAVLQAEIDALGEDNGSILITEHSGLSETI
jgi:hypothetical protein